MHALPALVACLDFSDFGFAGFYRFWFLSFDLGLVWVLVFLSCWFRVPRVLMILSFAWVGSCCLDECWLDLFGGLWMLPGRLCLGLCMIACCDFDFGCLVWCVFCVILSGFGFRVSWFLWISGFQST